MAQVEKKREGGSRLGEWPRAVSRSFIKNYVHARGKRKLK